MIDLMIFEDEASQLETIKRKLHKRFPDSDIHTESNPYTVFTSISLLNPNILIVDYQFKSIKITDEAVIMSRLFKFKGLVIIFSGHAPNEIKKDMEDKYDRIPHNFRIISKSNPIRLMREIEKYHG